ncbi:asparagine synthase-related protein [Sphingobium phenoxybenzoativorans]|nr:asparagine synthase-related protein [Sphingobium phenoxybenzoativorans]
MAARFIAYAFRDRQDAAMIEAYRQAPETLHLLFCSSRLMVFGNIECAPAILTNNGIVIGDIFAKPHFAKPAREEAQWFTKVYTQKGFPGLLRSCWGAYVAFLDDSCGGRLEVLCSPLGNLPCYKLLTPWGAIFGSDPDILVSMGHLVPAVDFQMVDAQLRFRTLRSPRTALRYLEELPGGCAWQLGDPETVTDIWSPWTFTATPRQLSQPPVQALAEVVRYCVETWANQLGKLLLSLSGGLDSSVVAACLKGTRSDVNAVNLHDGTPASDERVYAHAVMNKCLGSVLTDLQYDMEAVDINISSARMLPRPCGSALAQGVNGARHRLATELNCPAIFTGFGGDGVFCYLTSASPIVDRIRSDGLTAGLSETLMDICTMTGGTVIEGLIHAGLKVLRPNQRRYYSPDLSFLTTDRRAQLAVVPHHPWIEAPKGQLPGKIAHVGMIAEMLNGLDGFARDEALVDIAPLMSQPVVELCLAIPTWMWCRGGVDRIPIRESFQEALPAEIISRTWKGGPDGLAGALFERNREGLSLLFRNSLLVSHGIIDEKSVLARLEDSMPVRAGENLRLLELADAECWARHWSDRGTLSPSAAGKGAAGI